MTGLITARSDGTMVVDNLVVDNLDNEEPAPVMITNIILPDFDVSKHDATPHDLLTCDCIECAEQLAATQPPSRKVADWLARLDLEQTISTPSVLRGESPPVTPTSPSSRL
eukprot:1795263-Pyramimonas_sp.AAC.1